jgi:hypothetical protein
MSRWCRAHTNVKCTLARKGGSRCCLATAAMMRLTANMPKRVPAEQQDQGELRAAAAVRADVQTHSNSRGRG